MVVRIRGWAAHRGFSCDAIIVSRSKDELIVDTDDGHRVKLRPRHANFPIGSDPIVLCHFFWDGEFIAVARLEEHDDGDLTIVPQDYSYSEDYEYVPPRP